MTALARRNAAIGRRRRLVAVGLVLVLAGAGLVIYVLSRPPKLYCVTILPSLGGDFVLPCAINERGQVAGFSEVTKHTYHLFLWDREKGIQDLGLVNSDRVDLNNFGQTAGTMEDPNGHERAFIWDPNDGRTVLPTLGGSQAKAHAINDLGQVVGEAEDAAGVRHAFLWDPTAGIRDLTPSAASKTRAWSVNNAGQIIVFGQGGPLLIDADENAASKPRPIPVLGLIRINDMGQIAATAQRGPRRYDIVVWREDSRSRVLFQLEAYLVDTPVMNDAGQVAFTWTRRPRRKIWGHWSVPVSVGSCYWDARRGRMLLDRYVPDRGDEVFSVTGLNNHACIVGQLYSSQSGCSRGVLLEPIPERWTP